MVSLWVQAQAGPKKAESFDYAQDRAPGTRGSRLAARRSWLEATSKFFEIKYMTCKSRGIKNLRVNYTTICL